MDFISELKNNLNKTYTENGAIASKSTFSAVYDLFALGGSYRNRSERDCVELFGKAFFEDKELALKCLFYQRDVIGGQGERAFFRVCYRWLLRQYPDIGVKFLKFIPNYGRWDDLIFLSYDSIEPVAESIFKILRNQLLTDLGEEHPSLFAKWLPSPNASSKETKEHAYYLRTKCFNLDEKTYRKTLSTLRKKIRIVERFMSNNDWESIDFSKVPSKAMMKYRNCFWNRLETCERFEDFINNKNTKVHSDTLYPYEIISKVRRDTDTNQEYLNKAWEDLPDYFDETENSILCVCDTSGSMTCRLSQGATKNTPLDVSLGLGIYCAERNKGYFHNTFMTFSRKPQLVTIKGNTLKEKLSSFKPIVDDTNLESVFNLLLKICLTDREAYKSLPETIVIISDMEINKAEDFGDSDTESTMKTIRKRWKNKGLKMPKLVYWNVCASNNIFLEDNHDGITYVSGCSPVIFKSVISGKTGIDLMLDTLNSERYKDITLD